MFRSTKRFPAVPGTLAALVLASESAPALADPSLPPPASMPLPADALVMDLGLAGRLVPRFPGSDETTVRPLPLFGVERLSLPGVGVVADGPARGVSVYPTFRFEGERKAADNPGLAGLRDRDWGLGLGLGAGLNRKSWRVFGEVLAGTVGYSGLTARFGADRLWSPSAETVLAIGPRVDLVSRDYARTWFGVTPAESAASGGRLAPYAPGGGVASVGLAANWGRTINDRTMLTLGASWDHRLGDTADSPVVARGSRDAVILSAGLVWRLGFGGS